MQSTLNTVLAVIFLPFAAATVTPFVYRALGERTAYFASAIAAASLAGVTGLYLNDAHGTVAVDWIPSFDVSLAFHVDGLALLISFLASGVGVLILFYSGGYMHGEPGQARYYSTLLVFMGSMLGVALAGDLIALFVFWGLASLSSFVLIGYYTDEVASQYAVKTSQQVRSAVSTDTTLPKVGEKKQLKMFGQKPHCMLLSVKSIRMRKISSRGDIID